MMDKASQNFDKERSLRYWMIESPTYNFSTSLSTSLAQPLGIRFLEMDILSLGILASVQLGFVGLETFFGDLIINSYRFYNLKASPFRAGMAMAYKPSRALVLEELYGFWR
jgi:hypothetical protein